MKLDKFKSAKGSTLADILLKATIAGGIAIVSAIGVNSIVTTERGFSTTVEGKTYSCIVEKGSLFNNATVTVHGTKGYIEAKHIKMSSPQPLYDMRLEIEGLDPEEGIRAVKECFSKYMQLEQQK